MYTGPNTSTSGLVLALDAANTKSYPGSGTTWTDLSGNGNNGTLTNGPTFSSVNGGSISFDGTNDYLNNSCIIEAATSSNLQTYCSWLKGTSTNSSFFGTGASSTGQFHLILRFLSNGQLEFTESRYGGGGGVLDQSNIVTVNSNIWNFACIVKTASSTFNVYFNGNLVISNATKAAELSSTFSLGRWWVGQYAPSTIANVQIYNRALTPTEIQQNYNAQKSRFNL
jgi:hypothetical protein